MSESNKWGLVFHEVDVENQEFKTLLYLTGDHIRIKYTFNNIKERFKRNTGNPECVLSLVDVEDNESAIDDYPLTKMQLESVATLLGFELSKECIRKTAEESSK
ncbi:hypothetical protein ABE073_04400 [Lederbergia citrisecunda]|uniref:hypothetical protein n=1 Tax=Lederbergia citrisecunda TaxID=2833583 RepID=UPI003D28ED99